MRDPADVIRELYASFNRRNIPAVLARLHAEVAWANSLEGGHVHGREAVRDYWTRQWEVIDPRVEPLRIELRDGDVVAVDVHQVVHGLDGKLLLDGTVRHLFRFRDALVTRFDIEAAG